VPVIDAIKRIRTSLITLSAIITLMAPAVTADPAAHPATQGEKDFYASVVVPALKTIKKAMPPAPNGWVVASETQIPSAPPKQVTGDLAALHVAYTITYKRLAGVRDEQRRLDDAYADSSNKNQEAAKPVIDELIRQQTETSLALRKASRRRNQHEMQRLNEELDENGRKMTTIHEDVDKRVSRDVEPYLVKDAEASIRISLNDNRLELPQGEAFVQQKAAFALRREGERLGITSWREGRTVILFGNWEPVGEDRFRAHTGQRPFSPKVQTIMITVTGDGKRADTLIARIDLRTILDLME
jgi:hypothetical protein